jgi:hypothetical protein
LESLEESVDPEAFPQPDRVEEGEHGASRHERSGVGRCRCLTRA